MARIRTIKPEFWSHPVMGRLSDCSRGLALALLNFADDSGYFLADPILVRNFARPFDEDSSSTRRALESLSIAGWIEVVEHPSHGPIGRVVNFNEHQRIDRPTPSRIKDYFDSSNPRRVLDEPSPLEQGTGNRECTSSLRSDVPVPPVADPPPGIPEPTTSAQPLVASRDILPLVLLSAERPAVPALEKRKGKARALEPMPAIPALLESAVGKDAAQAFWEIRKVFERNGKAFSPRSEADAYIAAIARGGIPTHFLASAAATESNAGKDATGSRVMTSFAKWLSQDAWADPTMLPRVYHN